MYECIYIYIYIHTHTYMHTHTHVGAASDLEDRDLGLGHLLAEIYGEHIRANASFEDSRVRNAGDAILSGISKRGFRGYALCLF